MMNHQVPTLWAIFRHPRVWTYIFAGICIIFLTFFTNSNAIEIAISAIASIFIGIGVNHFAAMEMHREDMDEQYRVHLQVRRLLISVEKRLEKFAGEELILGSASLHGEIVDIQHFITICRELIKGDDHG